MTKSMVETLLEKWDIEEGKIPTPDPKHDVGTPVIANHTTRNPRYDGGPGVLQDPSKAGKPIVYDTSALKSSVDNLCWKIDDLLGAFKFDKLRDMVKQHLAQQLSNFFERMNMNNPIDQRECINRMTESLTSTDNSKMKYKLINADGLGVEYELDFGPMLKKLLNEENDNVS